MNQVDLNQPTVWRGIGRHARSPASMAAAKATSLSNAQRQAIMMRVWRVGERRAKINWADTQYENVIAMTAKPRT